MAVLCFCLLLVCVAVGCTPGEVESIRSSPESSSTASFAESAVSSEPQFSSSEVSSISQPVSSSEVSSVSSEESVAEIRQPEEFLRLLEAAGYTLDDTQSISQLILAESFGADALVHYYEKDELGQWSMVFEPSDGFVGVNGVGAAREGSMYTPYGLYSLDFAFGNAADPGALLEYRNVTSTIFWVDDPDSVYYNQWVDSDEVEAVDWNSAEHLSSVSVYDYAVVIGYNKDCVPGAGSAFFLHSSSGSPTAGCVSVPSEQMVEILRWLDPDCNPHIIMF